MTRKEAAGIIKFEKACVLRQDTPQGKIIPTTITIGIDDNGITYTERIKR